MSRGDESVNTALVRHAEGGYEVSQACSMEVCELLKLEKEKTSFTGI